MFSEKFPQTKKTELGEVIPLETNPNEVSTTALLSESYTVESGEKIELKYKHVNPQEGIERIPGKSVIFLSGWADMKLNSAMGTLQAYADNANADAYMIVPRAEGRSHANETGVDFLHEEAVAIVEFIKDHKMREVVVVGHSMGADRALNTTALLQEIQGLTIDGLILLAPVGLHERSMLDLSKGTLAYSSLLSKEVKELKSENPPFVYGMAENGARQESETREEATERIRDEQLDTVAALSKIVNSDAPGSITDELLRSKLGFPRRVYSEIADMSRKNEYAEEIRVPIVLIAGTDDPAAAHETIMPKEKEEEIRKELGEEEGRRDKVLAAREQYLQETVFPNSPAVKMFVPEKMGNHLGHIFRPETFAKTSLYTLERIKREEEKQISENIKNAA